MDVIGSNEFISQVERALALWKNADPRMRELATSIVSIQEHYDRFAVYTESTGEVFIAHQVAFWPDTRSELQERILATYIAHESVHAWLLAQGSEEWNTPKAEEVAQEYQRDIAKRIGVPEIYVTHPEQTLVEVLPPTSEVIVKPLGILIGITLFALILTRA